MFNGAISPVVSSLAYVADVLKPKYRGAGFGLVLGAFAAGIAVTPKLGILLGLERAVALGVLLKVLGLLYTLVRRPFPIALPLAVLQQSTHRFACRLHSSNHLIVDIPYDLSIV